MSNPDTIARLLTQAGEHLKSAIFAPSVTPKVAARATDAAMHCIHQAFQESIGGAAYARPEPSPQPALCGHCTLINSVPTACTLPPGHEGAHSDGDDEWCGPQPAAPAAVAGWVVKDITPGDPRPFLGRNHCWAPTTVDARPFTERADAEEAAKYGWLCSVTVLPVDAAGNVLEERAPAPDVVAQCRAAESEPAPREPDGWVVVYESGRGGPAWLVSDEHAEMNARNYAVGIGTARPFWLDTPPGPGVAWEAARAGEEAERLRAEVGKLRAALRAIAATCGGGIHETATTEFHCAVADEVRLVVERLTRERDEARFGGVCHALGCMVEAYELGGASASKLAEMLGWRVGELHGSGLQAVANMIFEAATELPQALDVARQCRDVALGERERAARLGLKREWFQAHSVVAHYDLVPSKRAEAVRLGAIEVDRRTAVGIWRRNRAGGPTDG